MDIMTPICSVTMGTGGAKKINTDRTIADSSRLYRITMDQLKNVRGSETTPETQWRRPVNGEAKWKVSGAALSLSAFKVTVAGGNGILDQVRADLHSLRYTCNNRASRQSAPASLEDPANPSASACFVNIL